jgi:predicted DNA-binding transcriptional regulator AlpA
MTESQTPTSIQSLPRFLTLGEAAKLYGMPRRRFERLVQKGHVPRGCKLGARRIFSTSVLLADIARLEAEAAAH